eukprot:COSAG06_NODE_3032_length_5939_cov_4.174114_7_plen_94_part_00
MLDHFTKTDSGQQTWDKGSLRDDAFHRRDRDVGVVQRPGARQAMEGAEGFHGTHLIPGAENASFTRFLCKTIISPIQAQDKHRETLKTKPRFP